jgi:hypothetical protein
VLFTVYAPPGIDEPTVAVHLQHIQENILVFSPDAEVESLNIYEGI